MVKKSQNLVNVVFERPLIGILKFANYFSVNPLDQKCQENGLLQKIDTLTILFEKWNQETSGIICLLYCDP